MEDIRKQEKKREYDCNTQIEKLDISIPCTQPSLNTRWELRTAKLLDKERLEKIDGI